jgi:hypothetical protein
LYIFLISSLRATRSTHLILLDSITLIILVKRTSYGAPRSYVYTWLSAPPPTEKNVMIFALIERNPLVGGIWKTQSTTADIGECCIHLRRISLRDATEAESWPI